jgi:hypothetical protein
MHGCEDGNFTSEFLVEVACVCGGLKSGDEWRRDSFMVYIVKTDGFEIWMFHDFESVSFT